MAEVVKLEDSGWFGCLLVSLQETNKNSPQHPKYANWGGGGPYKLKHTFHTECPLLNGVEEFLVFCPFKLTAIVWFVVRSSLACVVQSLNGWFECPKKECLNLTRPFGDQACFRSPLYLLVDGPNKLDGQVAVICTRKFFSFNF